MFCKNMLCAACALLFAAPGWAQLQKQIYDVVPTENVTSLEINPALDVIDHSADTSVSKVTLKGYYAFDRYFNVGVEVPLARFESPEKSKNGLGDVTLSLSAMNFHGNEWSFGSTFEFIAPTASDKTLGAGKVQFNPSFYGVYMPQSNFFFALGYKQFWSVAGDGGRENINMGRVRAIAGYLSDNQWWFLLDPRYVMDYENSGQAQFAPEAELGTMVNVGTAVYLRYGGKMAGNMPGTDWSVSIGFRILHL